MEEVFFLTEKLIEGSSTNRCVYFSSSIDLGTVLAQMIPFVIVGAGLIVTLKDKKSKHETSNRNSKQQNI